MKKMELTLIIQKGENNYYVGQLQEYPAVLSQGKTIEELKTNIADALKLYLEVQKEELNQEYKEKKILKRKLLFVQ
ncbi:MAG TPA: type II toxin-antitoxin system HicB family antitoxin [Chitinophagales bacterium]|nr:type II toxin-antitoxin system HicB family antitoxin [Chitinophagales bacterium]HRK26346.1 type II toxin-antitoxin system HicB family antitoxin [Chitinophagales bacterium]